MKYYIIAGEASGDLHGSNLIKEIKKNDKNARFRCWGGDLMQAQNAEIVKHIRELAFMGFKEVLLNIRTIKRNFNLCHKDILDYQPDVMILIDYPGFNLRVAEFSKKHNFKVVYYVSPQVWAWKKSRVKKIKTFVDKLLVILPFEKEFYKQYNYEVDFIGHPLLDQISNFVLDQETKPDFYKANNLPEKKIIALLPGSRKQEISKKLPVMLSVVRKFSDKFQFIIAGAPAIESEYYRGFIGKEVRILYDKTYDILNNSYAALVTSGTATLETALFEVPQVVCYKSGALSYHIAKRLVKVKYISLVNLIMDKLVVKELIQGALNEKSVFEELSRLIEDQNYRDEIIGNYKLLKVRLGGDGASCRAAMLIDEFLNE